MEKRGSCDPGWNDPPLFSYEIQTSQLIRGSRPRTLLNRRVAFPIHDASSAVSSNLKPMDPTAPLSSYDMSTLPPPPSISIIPPTGIQEKENGDSELIFNSLQALETVMSSLCDVLNTTFGSEEKDRTEIQRRLDIMKKMWIDDKLCRDVQLKLLQLSEALKKDETEKADHLQKGLMVDYAPACSTWMSGVRHLIHHKEPIQDIICDQVECNQ